MEIPFKQETIPFMAVSQPCTEADDLRRQVREHGEEMARELLEPVVH